MDAPKSNGVLDENEKEVAPLPQNLLYKRINNNKAVNKNSVLNKNLADRNRLEKRRAKNKRAKISRKKNRK